MSTRSCIGRLTSKPGKKLTWRACYHHWDGHPFSLGSTLFQIRNGHFKGDTEKMLSYLIDQHPQGFSTINGCDFNLPAAPRPDSKTEICKHCHLPNWRHYSQYYGETNPLWVEAGKPVCPPRQGNSYLVADHSPLPEDLPHGPECYPTTEKPFVVTEKMRLNVELSMFMPLLLMGILWWF